MAFKPRTWVNRHVQFPLRREYTLISDNIYDVKRAEGNITAEGDKFNAENMNDLEQRIDTAFKDANTEIETKADKTYVDTEIEKKTDKTYVDTALENKADITYVNDNFANALKGNASGSVISVDDVSPIQHSVKCKAESKNLLNLEVQEGTSQGITFSILADNTIHVYGKNDGETRSDIWLPSPIIPKDAENLVISTDKLLSTSEIFLVVGGSNGNYDYNEIFFDKFKSRILHKIKTDGDNTIGYFILRVNANSGAIDETFKLQIEKETKDAPTPYTPYVDVSNTNLNVCGKNLFDIGKFVKGKIPSISDGKIITTGEVNGYTEIKVNNQKPLCAKLYSQALLFYVLYYSDDKFLGFQVREAPANTINISKSDSWKDTTFIRVRVDNIKEELKTQVEISENPTEYEPYKDGGTYTPLADGTVNGIKSISPNMTLYSDTDGVNIEAEYNRDINKAFEKLQQAIISTGGNV